MYRSRYDGLLLPVERGEVEFGVLPVYNSTSGSVTPTYDLLGKYNCYITAMNQVKIKHCLAVRPGVSLEQIQAVYDAGYEEWILWNATNRYSPDGLLAAGEEKQ